LSSAPFRCGASAKGFCAIRTYSTRFGITLGATIVVRERQHLAGTNWDDHAAYRKQLEVPNQFGSDAFHSKGFYNKMTNFVKKSAAAGQ
jgi:hypothetical protein